MIYICVLSLNRRSILMRCLNSITPVLSDGVNLRVLEQQCSDTIPQMDFTIWAQIDANLGCAGGRKWLVESIPLQTGDILVFLDDDLYAINTTWLWQLVNPIQDGLADITGVEGRIINQDYMSEVDNLNPDYVSGGWCAISARVFLSGVIFDTRFINYFEDSGFCIIATTKGFRLQVVGDVGLIHEPHPGNAQVMLESRQRFIQYYGGRGLLRFERETTMT